MKTRYLNNNCHFEHYDIKHMFGYTIGELEPVFFTYPDVPCELNKFGKCLTTEISRKPYFSQQRMSIMLMIYITESGAYHRQMIAI